MHSRHPHLHSPAYFVRALALLTLLLASLAAILPVTPVYAVPILRLTLELAPGTPSPLPSGQPFTVRLTYECSSSIGTDACTNMQVVSTLPAQFEGLQALGNNDVTLAGYDPGTRTATWDFRSPLPLGTTGQLEFEVRYLPGTTLDGETGTITAEIIDDTASPGTGTITPPPASATAQPTLTKTLIAGGASNDFSLYRVALCAGTTGALDLTNSTITDSLPQGAVYVSSEPVGAYDSGARTITWSGVSVPASGSGCRNFDVVVAYPDSDVNNAIGAAKTNSASATTTPLSGTEQLLNTTVDHTLAAPDPELRLRKAVTGAEGTADTIVNGVITTRLIVDNIGDGPAPGGNVAINNVEIIDTIPAEYDVFSVNTGAATAVAYQRNGVNSWITGVTLGANVAVASFPGWNATDYVSRLRFSFPQISMTERSRAVSFQSTVVNPPNGGGAAYTITADAPRLVPNTASASASYPGFPLFTQDSSATIEVALPKARPDPRKTIVSGSPVLPGGTVRYELRLRNGSFDPLLEPVIADLLPTIFTFDLATANVVVTENIPGCAAQPTFTPIPNYNGSGRTMLLWSWATTGCSLPADEDARIEFNITVQDGTRAGQYPNRLALANYSNVPDLVRTSLCSPGGADAALFVDGSGIDTSRLCFSAPSNLTVRAIASIGSAKFVQGQLDTEFHRDPRVGQTVQGGLITYQMDLENTGNIDLTNLQIVDILPYNDGTTQNFGVRDQSPLGTAWTVQLAGPVEVTPAISELVIYYSSELNPCREDFTADPNIGCTPMVDGIAPGPGIWSTQLPSDPTAVRSLRFDFGSYALQPLQVLSFTFPAFAPVDAPVSGNGPDNIPGNSDDTNVAWNTFAYQATRADDGSTLVAQPPRVGITVRDTLLAAYGNYVWHDVNGDGIQNEPPTRGLNGVVVRLFQPGPDGDAGTADDLLIGEQFTRNDSLGNPGFYLFNNLEPGNYFAEFETPAGYNLTGANLGGNDALDSDVDLITLRTAITTLSADETDLSWDAGYIIANAVSLGNRLWYDTNNDGLDNDGASGDPGSSSGVSGARVELFLDSDGNGFLTGNERNWIATATTNAAGFYIFTEQTRDVDGAPLTPAVPLFPGQYIVGIPPSEFGAGGPLAGYHSSLTTLGADAVISETPPPSPNTDQDFDDNGRTVRYDSTATLFDPFDLAFSFYNGGVLSLPVFVSNSEPTGEPHPYADLPDPNPDARSNLSIDFGFYTASLGDLVWVDDGTGLGGVIADGIRNGSELGIANIPVRLLAENDSEITVGPDGILGTADDAPGGVLTDATGNYSFSGLPQGNYRVRIVAPGGYVSTRDTTDTTTPNNNLDDQDNGVGVGTGTITSNLMALTPGSDGTASNNTVTTTSGSTDEPTLDFGIVRYYSLGNRIWNDRNNDGLHAVGELGVPGVSVRLLQSDGTTPAVHINGSPVADQITNANGYYRFDSLFAGEYVVEIIDTNFIGTGALRGYRSSTGAPTAPFPYEPAPDPDTGLDGLASTADDDTDRDDNGTFGAGSVRSLPVSLGEGTGTQEPTNDNDPATNPETGEAPNNQANRTVDFGFVPVYSLGNRVWYDADNSGNRNGTEAGIANVTVRLLTSGGATVTDVDGNPVTAQTTDANGYYRFDNLLAGDYIVEVVAANFAPLAALENHFSSTGPNQEANPNLNVDNNDNGLDTPVVGAIRSGVVSLGDGDGNQEPTNDNDPATNPEAGESRNDRANRSVDFGFVEPISLGNRVFYDTNNNLADNDGAGNAAGSSTGISDVTVYLYQDVNRNGTLNAGAEQQWIAQATTDGNGFYQFTTQTHFNGAPLAEPRVLLPGRYQIVIPADQLAVGAPLAGYHSSGVTLDNAGTLAETASPNPSNNGVDRFDKGMRQTAGFLNGSVATRIFTLTSRAMPTNEPEDAGTAPGGITILNNNSDLTLDFGFYTASFGNLVWVDDGTGVGGILANGLREPGEGGLAGVELRLYNNNNDVQILVGPDGILGTADDGTAPFVTGTDGTYRFIGLPQGNYRVRMVAPAGYVSTRDTAGTATPNGNLDDDDNGVGTGTGTITSNAMALTPGAAGAQSNNVITTTSGSSYNPTLDFGIVRSYSLGNRVWQDSNNNGLQEAGEAGIDGVTVRLLQSDGLTPAVRIDGTTAPNQMTAGGGYYRFDLLPTGDYIVELLDANFIGVGALRGYRSSTGAPTGPFPYEPAPDPDTGLDGILGTADDDTDRDDNGTHHASGSVRSLPVSLGEGTGTQEPTNDNDPVTNPETGEAPNNQANRSVDFGFVPVYSLGNRVWYDANNSGDRTGAEAGIDGVIVRLLTSAGAVVTDVDGIPVADQTTTGGGYYRFDNLLAGDYIVEVLAANFSGVGQLVGMYSSTGPAPALAFEPASDPNTNSTDNDDNGTFDLVSGSVRSGIVTLGPGNSEPEGETDPATNPETGEAPDNRSNRTVDFGFITPVSLGNLIFHDRDNNGTFDGADVGLAGATVELRDSLGNPVTDVNGASVAAQITTDGSYLFVNLRPGDYRVRVTPPASFVSSDDIATTAMPNNNTNNDDNGIGSSTSGAVTSGVVTLISGTEPDGAGDSNLTLDFGFYQPLSLGDLVFHDRDNDGQYDPAIDLPLAAATVELFLDADGSGALEANNAAGVDETVALANQTTGADGLYRFDDLKPGAYLARVTPPAGYRSSDDIAGSSTPDNNSNNDDNGLGSSVLGAVESTFISLRSGEEPQESGFANLTLDFGFYQLVSLGELIFEDFADDGTFTSGLDLPLQGALVELFFADGTTAATDITGNAVASQTTGANGLYLFSSLKPNRYVVRVTPPAGVGYRSSSDIPTSLDPDNNVNLDDNGLGAGTSAQSNPLTLRSGDEPTTDGDGANGNLTLDFAFHRPLSLGNRVFLDANNDGLDNDGNGTPGSSPGLANLPVRLYRDSDNDGTPDGVAIQSTTTNDTGHYLFIDLIADRYIVEVVPPAGYRSSTGDLGAYEPAPDPDANQDDYDDNGNQFAPATIRSATIALAPGTQPTGELATPGLVDSTPDESANYTVDFGLYQPLSLGNRVFVDANNDGFDNDGDGTSGSSGGIANLPVRLYRDSNGDGTPDGAAIQTVNTNADGYYLFTDLGADTYLVELDLLAGMRSSTGLLLPPGYEPAPDPNTNPTDFDDNGTTIGAVVRSAPLSLNVGGAPTGEPATPGWPDPYASDANANYTLDFGFYSALSLGNLVWNDVDNSGAVNGGEVGLESVTVRLYRDDDGNGQPDDLDGMPGVTIDDAIATTTTNAAGYYLFTGLSAGGYIVEVVPPTGYRSSTGPASAYEPAIPPVGNDEVDHGGEAGGIIRSQTVTLSIGGAPTGEPTTPGFTDPTADDNSNLTIDFGLYRALRLGDLVFFDRDNNGRYDPALDLPLEGATLRLFEGNGTTRARDADGNQVADQVSDANGNYQFGNLSPGDYRVRVTPPTGYRSSDDIGGITDNPNGDDNDYDKGIGSSITGDVFSGVITLVELSEPINDDDTDPNSNLTLDFGFYRPLSLGDLIFHDRANDGLFDGSDSPLAGATVELLRGGVQASDADGNPVLSQTTSVNNGNYLFSNLKPGDYVVRVTPPDGYRSSDDIFGSDTPNNDANNDDNGIGDSVMTPVASNPLTLLSGDEPIDDGDNNPDSNLTLDFGFYQPLSLGDLIFHDRDNNGRYDPVSDLPLEGATVTLYLDDGTTRASDVNGAALPELITDASGLYRFDNLKPGYYIVNVNPPEGFRSSDDLLGVSDNPDNNANNDDNGIGSSVLGDVFSNPITLFSGDEPNESGLANLTLDFGFYRTLSLGELVFEDFANDGVFNAADAPLAGALVALFFADGATPATAVDGTLVASQTTGTDGLYLFDNLKPGRYVVRVTAPEGYSSSNDITSTANPDNDVNLDDNGVNNLESLDGNRRVFSNPITLRSGGEPTNDGDGNDSNLTLDFGFFRPSALGDRVWLDLNRDGIQDANESEGVPGVTVRLYDATTMTVLATTTSDSDGFYRFERLGARTYLVEFELPLGYARSPQGQGSDPALDSDADPTSGRTLLINLATATTDLRWDAGLYFTASLGDRVWFDRNANGIQDAGEVGVADVTVTLYAADGTTVLATTTTDANGFYAFSNLAPGSYLIEFTPPAGYELSPANQGNNRGGDSDPDPTTRRTAVINLAPGASDTTWDAGIFQRVRLGNLVWEDTNNNGQVDPDERGLANLPVRLFSDLNGDGQPDGTAVATTTTNGNGFYLFANLVPGNYLVEISPPPGYTSSTGVNGSAVGPYEPAPSPNNNLDNDDNGSRLEATLVRSNVITLWSQSEPAASVDGDDSNGNLSLDFGLFRPAALGSLVWYDTDGDGRRGPGEAGVSRVRVSLRYADGTPVLDAAGRWLSVVTDTDGGYLFDYLTPGSYQVYFDNLPSGYTFTAPGLDSDADPLTSASPAVSLDPGERNLDLWAGLINPTAITLMSFSATPDVGGLLVRWTTADERDSWGFHLWRSADGTRASAERVTVQRILARGGPQQGASYRWLDSSAVPGVTYSYWLEELEVGGRLNEYGPITATSSLRATEFRVLLPLVQR